MHYDTLHYFLFFLLIANCLSAQNPAIAIGNTTACQGEMVEVLVAGSNLNNIGAITLFIDYNPSCLAFDTVTNIHSGLSGLIFNDIQDSAGFASIGRFALSWNATFAGVNLGNNNLITLNFQFLGPATSLTFNSGCEIADFDANILNVTLQDAQVDFLDTVEINVQPQAFTLIDNGIAAFMVDATNASDYAWEMSSNGVWGNLSDDAILSGTASNTLSLTNPGLDWNGRYFRCSIEGCNSTLSDSAMLQVFLGIAPENARPFNWKVGQSLDVTYININNRSEGILSLSLVALDGKIMERIVSGRISEGQHKFQLSTKNTGLYFLTLDFSMTEQSIHQTKKIFILNP